eukprot:scaffold18007_cov76-Cylindrotheca_fusiformis.AAC.1
MTCYRWKKGMYPGKKNDAVRVLVRLAPHGGSSYMTCNTRHPGAIWARGPCTPEDMVHENRTLSFSPMYPCALISSKAF